MSDTKPHIDYVEQALVQAMLTSDVGQLDALIDDALLFVGPDGQLISKQDDLGLHRCGEQRITTLQVLERRMQCGAAVASVSVVAALAGVFKGQPFAGRFRYLRVWHNTAAGWRIVAGSVCALPLA